MSYPLKRNLTNKQNVTLTSLDDTKLDDNFAKSLELLITNWVQNGVYNISLMNTLDGNNFAVVYSTYTITTNPTPADANLAEYIKNNVNPSLTDGQLNIDTSNKKITYSKKEKSTTTSSGSTSGTSGTSISSALSSASGHTDNIDELVAKLGLYKSATDQGKEAYDTAKSLSGVTSGLTTTTTTKKVQTESKIKNEILREEIIRIKKLINYGI